MTKYLMILAALMLMVACGGDENNDKIKYTEDGWAIYAGLEWSPRSGNGMNWDTAIGYCESKGARLPNINELRKSIINCPGSTYGGLCQVSDPDCLSWANCYSDYCNCDGSAQSYSAFGDERNGLRLWSSSTFSQNDSHAWAVDFNYGFVLNTVRYESNEARCVRDPDDLEATDNVSADTEQPDENVDTEKLDSLTDDFMPDTDVAAEWIPYAGLEWSPQSENKMNFNDAFNYCQEKEARLPNIDELRMIIINCPSSTFGGVCQVSAYSGCVDMDCYSEDCHCDGTADSYSALGDGKEIKLWSETYCLGDADYAWVVHFGYGDVGYNTRNGLNNARCVRELAF